MNEQTIPISALTLDPELQPRAVMDADLVAEYVDAMDGGAEFPPSLCSESRRLCSDGLRES